MSNIRITRDDLVPLMADAGIAEKIKTLAARNCPDDVLLWEVQDWAMMPGLTWDQLHSIITDLKENDKLHDVVVMGTGNVTPTIRPAAPTGIGVSSANVWANAPAGEYIFRFYVNGVLKLTIPNYYITSRESIGAETGDVVQICCVAPADIIGDGQVVVTAAGTVGWFARIVVS